MKSIFNYIALSVLVLFLATSCENDADIHTFPDPDINFSFRDTYTSDYFIWSDIQFTNSSVKKGSPTWDFGDGTTSNEENPIHSYNEPGVYNVKLTLDGVGTLSKKLYISDIKVVANYTSTDSTVEIKKSPVVLDVYLPNPKDSIESYEWIFPEGTLDENGNPISSSLEKDPGVLKFKNVGSQTITLKTKLGTRVLPNREVNIQVGYDTPVKTLYYAVKDGKINALKIIKTLPSDVQNKPYILNASSGQNSLCILFHDSLLYVLDAGFKATWQDDSFGIMGDGKITVVSKDGLTTEVMLDNTGGAANDDPFYGYIDGNTFYVSDRNTGISKLQLSDRNKPGKRIDGIGFWVANDRIGYYNISIRFGALNSSFFRINDVWWWGKLNSNGGIFRFQEQDILATGIGTAQVTPPSSGSVLAGAAIRSMALDNARSVLYVAIPSFSGIYRIPVSEINSITTVTETGMKKYLIQSNGTDVILPNDIAGTNEPFHVTQMVVDEEDGCLYFGYRAPATGASEATGLKRYDPNTKKVETLIEGVSIYGITLNNKKSKLF